MRTIRYTTKFKKDYRRELRGRHAGTIDKLLLDVVRILAADEPLPPRNFDHALTGDWQDCRDCHLRPDLALIYRKPDETTLELMRIGSHSELDL
jgi:mRNA interferase YafQ